MELPLRGFENVKNTLIEQADSKHIGQALFQIFEFKARTAASGPASNLKSSRIYLQYLTFVEDDDIDTCCAQVDGLKLKTAPTEWNIDLI